MDWSLPGSSVYFSTDMKNEQDLEYSWGVRGNLYKRNSMREGVLYAQRAGQRRVEQDGLEDRNMACGEGLLTEGLLGHF